MRTWIVRYINGRSPRQDYTYTEEEVKGDCISLIPYDGYRIGTGEFIIGKIKVYKIEKRKFPKCFNKKTQIGMIPNVLSYKEKL